MPKPTFYITTAIDYPNAKPHMGHAYEKIISDFIARWHRLLGEDVFFLTGTDEHGQKIERTALSQGKKPKELVDGMVLHFEELLKKLNISNDDFIRTTEKRHTKVCQQIFQQVLDKGDIYLGKYEGLYCTGCEAFYTEKDLFKGKCPVHQKEPEKISEESYFFKMSKYQQKLLDYISQHPEFILPDFRRNEIVNWIKEGLKDISVSRKSTKWGIPLLNDKSHFIYVWFDALLNYISALGGVEGKKFKKYWPANVHIIGKDINRFHTVIWPAILFSAGINLPKTVHSHGFVNIGGEKMSKSRGITLDPLNLAEKYGADRLRYFLLRETPAGADCEFSEEALINRNNSELADSLGNLLQRTSVLIHKNFSGEIPKPGKLEKIDKELIAKSEIFEDVNRHVQNYEWHRAIECIWDFIRQCNKYVTETQPWTLTENKERLGTILYTVAECLRIISIYVYPIIPASAEKIAAQLGQKIGTLKQAKFKKTTKGKLLQPEILFSKLEFKAQAPADEPIEDDFNKLNLKVAKITSAEPHPDADKLLVLQIDIGTEKRPLVAGLRKHYFPEQLAGKNIVIISNLKPAMIRGKESRGMLLAAEKDGIVKVLEPKGKPGDDVFVKGYHKGEKEITIDAFLKIKLTTKGGQAVYNNAVLQTNQGPVTVDLPDGASIR